MAGLAKVPQTAYLDLSGQPHGRLLLWTGGTNVSSVTYALMFSDLQLIEFCVSHGAIARVSPLTCILSLSGGEDTGEGDVSA